MCGGCADLLLANSQVFSDLFEEICTFLLRDGDLQSESLYLLFQYREIRGKSK